MNPKDWPENPGVCVRDFRTLEQWSREYESEHTFNARVFNAVDCAFAMGEGALVPLAMACYEQEGGPTRLAMDYNNLFGIVWSDTLYNRRTYPAVRFEGNAHDQAAGIPTRYYRVYSEPMHCVQNWRWHLMKSANYRHLWPLWEQGETEKYIRSFRLIWANGNEDDPPSVISNYRKWVRKIEASEFA